MNNILNQARYYFSSDYLLTANTGTKFELFYLYFSVALIVLCISALLYFRNQKISKFDSFFPKLVFWGMFSLSLVGVLIWFFRSQGLALFSTRAFSYLWLVAVLVTFAYFGFYFYKKMPENLKKYAEKKRKQKYLR